MNANDACRDLFPQKKDTVEAELYGIPTGSISLHCVCLCTLATRNPPGLLRHQLVLSLSLSLHQVCSALFFFDFTTMSLSPCEALAALFPSTTRNTCSHTQSPYLLRKTSPEEQWDNYGEISLRKHSALRKLTLPCEGQRKILW